MPESIIEGRGPHKPLGKPQNVKLEDASICFYTQKVKHFCSIPISFTEWLKGITANKKDGNLRLYTLAGNPMMVKLANGENIHAVFEHYGQHPHDAVPVAYIGIKSGAHLVDRDGEITEEKLAATLLKPSGSNLKYVLASTRELADQLAKCLPK